MKKETASDQTFDDTFLKDKVVPPSEFRGLKGIEYFDFEEDFIEQNVRCIPMIVRFKMDAAGIKLSLAEWSKFSVNERQELALRNCNKQEQLKSYNGFLANLIRKYTGNEATVLKIDPAPAWSNIELVPEYLQEKANELNCNISTQQWRSLSNLQRFALLKLYRPGHENKNFRKALKEFDLID